jgi:ABC-type uncharacterized transport system substrate-binding protein
VLVPKAAVDKLLNGKAEHRDKPLFSAIYLDQPSYRQIDLIIAALPETHDVGLLYSSRSGDELDLRKAIMEKRLVPQEQQSDSIESLHRDLQSVLQRSDVLLAIPDVQIYNSSTIRNILLESYRKGIPIIGFSPAYIRAGALCAVFSTPEQIAIQASNIAKQFSETNRLPSAQYPSDFDVMVNQQVAHSLGIQIKESSELLRWMKAAESVAGGAK